MFVSHRIPFQPRKWLEKIVKKMSLKDKERVEKAKDDKDTAMVIRKVDSKGVTKVSHVRTCTMHACMHA